MKRGTALKRTALARGSSRLKRTQMKRVGKRREREAEALAKFNRNPLWPGSLAIPCVGCESPDHYHHAHHLCSRARGAGHPLLHDTRNRAWLCAQCHRDAHEGKLPHLIRSRDYLDSLTT